jgi:methylated-DNA-[protein]-cysteine S-methyltransferase
MKTEKTNYYYKMIASPVGKLKLIASDKGLAAILWENDKPARVRDFKPVEDENHPILLAAEQQLAQYFAGTLKAFSVPLDQVGTPFQQKVWKELSAIPFGETRTYGQLARKLGDPKLSRAVGSANQRNPVSIIVPCHRVLGSTGALTGFAGGLETKASLLALEGAKQFQLWEK